MEDDPWKETNRNTLAKMGVAVSECVVPLSERGTVGYNLLTSREKMVLGHALLACPQLHNADIYQSLGREFLSDVPVLSTIVPGSMKWIRPLKRLLLGYEALKVQGLPDDLMKLAVKENYSDNSMMDLAGNSFTGMVYCAFLISALVHATLPTSGDKTGQSTNEIAASVLDICLFDKFALDIFERGRGNISYDCVTTKKFTCPFAHTHIHAVMLSFTYPLTHRAIQTV